MSRVPTPLRSRKATRVQAIARACADPAWSKTLACRHAPCAGTGRSLVRPQAPEAAWSASGRRGAEADDARAREVRPRHSSCEALEQRRFVVCGGGGAKDEGRGEHGPGQHAPDTEPDPRVTGTGPCTANRKAQEEGTVHRAPPPPHPRPAPD